MTNILIIGKKNGILHWYENVIDALQTFENVNVLEYPINHSSTLDNIRRKTVKFFSRRTFETMLRKKFETVLIRQKPDIVLFVDLVDYPDYILELVEEHKTRFKTAFWIGDLFDSSLNKWKKIIDHFLFTDTHFLEMAQEMGIRNTHHFPLAYNERIFQNRTPIESRKKEMLFIGAYSDNRHSLFQNIRSPMVIMGKKWNQKQLRPHHVIDKRISIDKVADYYNGYQCILNIKNSNNVINGVNMRTFDATASGCVLFNDALNDLSLYFDTQKDLVVYHDIDELNFLYDDYLSRPEKYYQIAQNGYQRSHSNHSYRHRMETLFGIIKNG